MSTARVRTEPAEGYLAPAGLDLEAAYRAMESRDQRFDGRLWVGVTTTGIYCRPVCPAQTPKRGNVRFFAAPAAAVSAGFRACRRCRPDSAPGSRSWDHRADLAGRALRLIADGALDDEDGVTGLATRLHVSERQLHRTLVAEVGTGPLQLAVSRRAQTARMLVDQTTLALTEVAFAAGFSSIRQFNDVMRREFGCPPSELRRTATPDLRADAPTLVLRLRFRPPYGAAELSRFLAARTVPGLERHSGHAEAGWRHERPAPLPGGVAAVSVEPYADHVLLRTRQADLRDTAVLVRRVRRWLDLDADPQSVADVLGADPGLAPRVAAHPGLRVATTVDAWETCVRAVVGQQVSVAGSVTLLGRLVAAYGAPLPADGRADDDDRRTFRNARAGDTGDGERRAFPDGRAAARPDGWDRRAFPDAAALAAAGPERLAAVVGMPASRGRTLHGLAEAVATGAVPLDGGTREDVLAALDALPGVGPWTRDYIALRALADPDAFPATDLGILHAARDLTFAADARALSTYAERWRPWRAYAAQHLWTPIEETS